MTVVAKIFKGAVFTWAVVTVSTASFALPELTEGVSLLKLRDPFRPIAVISPDEKPRSPLEAFSADQFKMVGVVTGPDAMKAMLIGPDGKSYFVQEKSRIGIRRGYVKRIDEDSIRVTERVQNELGQEEVVETVISLPEEKRAKSEGVSNTDSGPGGT